MKIFFFLLFSFSLSASSIFFETKLPIQNCFSSKNKKSERKILNNLKKDTFPSEKKIRQLSIQKAKSQKLFIECILKKKLSTQKKKNSKKN